MSITKLVHVTLAFDTNGIGGREGNVGSFRLGSLMLGIVMLGSLMLGRVTLGSFGIEKLGIVKLRGVLTNCDVLVRSGSNSRSWMIKSVKIPLF